MLIADFMRKFNASKKMTDEAFSLGHTTMQALWADEKLMPTIRIWIATRIYVLTHGELRVFAIFCARQVQHMMANPMALSAMDALERKGTMALDGELKEIKDAATKAAWAAQANSWALQPSDLIAAEGASSAARAAAGDPAAEAQALYLLANIKPEWERWVR